MFKFKLLHGSHIEDDKSKPKNAEGRYPEITYRPGAIIETETDLVGKFCIHGMPPKFERVIEGSYMPISQINKQLAAKDAEIEELKMMLETFKNNPAPSVTPPSAPAVPEKQVFAPHKNPATTAKSGK